MDHAPQFQRGEQTSFLLAQGRAAAPFHAPSGLAYLSIPTGPDTQTAVPLYSRRAELWLTAAFIREYDCAPAPGALRAARKALEALALYQGPEKPVGKRILGGENKIALDLAGDSGLCVEITSQGWTVAPSLEHAFEREPATGALPVPDPDANRGAALPQLRALLNIPSQEAWNNVLLWLTAALRPQGPYPILHLDGPTGAGKSTAANILRSLIDPAGGNRGHVVICDVGDRIPNLAKLSETHPIVLIRASARLDEHIARRAIAVHLQAPRELRTLQSLRAAFLEIHAQVLAALCDAVVQALQNIGTTSLQTYARLPDATAWAAAASGAAPLSPALFDTGPPASALSVL